MHGHPKHVSCHLVPHSGLLLLLLLQGNAASWIKTTLMLEEYLDGPEVDVDLVISDGQPVYGAITDNWPTIEPYFNETGSNCPSILPIGQQRQLIRLAVQSVQSLGLSLVSHCGPLWCHCVQGLARS